MQAICSKCGKGYYWTAYRGSVLADQPSPCCRAPGEALPREKSTAVPKVCPDCGKGGLYYRKALMEPAKFPPRPAGMYAAMYCPRCKKWVNAIRKIDKGGEQQ